MTSLQLGLSARTAPVYLKIAVALFGIAAADCWYQSAVTSDEAAVNWNTRAVLTTGLSMLLQALSAGFDVWISPTATSARARPD